MASVYWIRSLVPIEKNAVLRASRSATHTALGVSTIMPIGSAGSCGTPVRRSSAATSAHSALARCSSSRSEIIGNINRTVPWALAR